MLAAAGVFAYQCLDAMDGEQGRRTQAETPLEDLFDHGCDAISSGQSWLLTLHMPGLPLAVICS